MLDVADNHYKHLRKKSQAKTAIPTQALQIFYNLTVSAPLLLSTESIDTRFPVCYTLNNSIGQFVTLLSVNKTRLFVDGRSMRSFCFGCELRPFFFWRDLMNKKVRFLVYGALIAALYVALTHLQNLLIPGSATWAIQFRVSEALCILAFFTPAAIPGLTIGCFLFNLSFAMALPLDFLIGSLATLLATGGMYLFRRITVRGIPVLGLLLPGIFNGALVGWELSVYIGGGFWLNALYVAIGEIAVLLTLGTALYYAMKQHGLANRLFG